MTAIGNVASFLLRDTIDGTGIDCYLQKVSVYIYIFIIRTDRINSCNVHYKTKNQKRILLVDENLDDSNEKIRKKTPRNN